MYIGWRFNQILQADDWLKTHLVLNSTDVIRRFDFHLLKPSLYITGVAFDIVELYPSLPTSVAVLEAIFEFLSSLGIEDAEDLVKLLEFLFSYSWFSFQDQFFSQTEGLAMGTPHSPPIANLIVYLLFETQLRQEEYKPEIYQRYLDDGMTIWLMDRTTVEKLCAKWNNWIAGIQFTFEFVDLAIPGNKIIFLDLNIRIERRRLIFSTYQKVLNQYLYVHAQSTHPRQVKTAIVHTELIRFLRTNSLEEDYLFIRDLFFKRMRLRGYSAIWLKKAFAPFNFSRREQFLQKKDRKEKKIPLLLKVRYTLDTKNLFLGAKLTSILQNSYLRELGLSQEDRIIICHLKSQNLRELIIRNSDHRSSSKVTEDQIIRISRPPLN